MAKKTSTALTVVPSTPAPQEPTAATELVPTLDQLAATIREAQDEIEGHAFDALQSAIRLGVAAIAAKEQLPRGEFLPWIAKHCSKSQPWVAACMNAARAEALLCEKSAKEQARLREGANSIEAFAALYRPLKAGDPDPLAPTTLAPKRAPRKAATATPQPAPWPPAGAGTSMDDGTVTDVETVDADMPPQRVANIKADLDAQRAELDARERALVLREAACTERERVLEEKEADYRFREMLLGQREQAANDAGLSPAPEPVVETPAATEEAPKATRRSKAKAKAEAEAEPIVVPEKKVRVRKPRAVQPGVSVDTTEQPPAA